MSACCNARLSGKISQLDNIFKTALLIAVINKLLLIIAMFDDQPAAGF